MLYIPAEKSADGIAKVVYHSKDGKSEQTFDALDWLPMLVVHTPNKYEPIHAYRNIDTRTPPALSVPSLSTASRVFDSFAFSSRNRARGTAAFSSMVRCRFLAPYFGW